MAFLPKSITPVKYHLRIWPNTDGPEFKGEVTIEIDVTVPTKSIGLHAKDLTISSAKIDDEISEWSAMAECEMLFFKSATELAIGKHELFVSYEGKHADQLVGFYRCVDANGRVSFNTQFDYWNEK